MKGQWRKKRCYQDKVAKRRCLKCDKPIKGVNRLCDNCNESNARYADAEPHAVGHSSHRGGGQ